MTNKEYVLINYNNDNVDDLINILCPSDFDENLHQLMGCNGECIECWNLEVEL